jgi:hypothetical protein
MKNGPNSCDGYASNADFIESWQVVQEKKSSFDPLKSRPTRKLVRDRQPIAKEENKG